MRPRRIETMIKKRIAALRRLLRKESLDGLLVSLPANRRYLSGFTPEDGQLGESSGSLFITPGDAVLLTDFRYELTAREQAQDLSVRIYKRGLGRELAGLLEGSRLKKLGIESEGLLVYQKEALQAALGDKVELVSTRGLAAKLRRVKSALEVWAMERSLALMEGVLAGFLADDLAGRTEREIALAVTRATEDAGAEGPAFPPIVASGPNGAEPHAEPGSRVLKEGDPVIFDVGASLEGYASDISRTVVVGGQEKADDTFKRIYAVVRKAQLAAIGGIEPGMTGEQADAIARKVIAEAGYGERFGHSLGHGVGLLTHEAPSVGPHSTDVLLPGMVFTIEPGIYLPGQCGVRLEQMVEMTEYGCNLLNQLEGFYDFD